MKKKASRKKPTVAIKLWRKESDWVVKYLEQLQRTASAHGLPWTFSMVNYYAGRYVAHHKNAPRACKKQAREYMRRVGIVTKWARDNCQQ